MDPNSVPKLYLVRFGGTETHWVYHGMLTQNNHKYSAWVPEGHPIGFITYINSKKMVLGAICIQYNNEKAGQRAVRDKAASLCLNDTRAKSCFFQLHPLTGVTPQTPFGLLNPLNVRAGFLQVPHSWDDLFPPVRTMQDDIEPNMEAWVRELFALLRAVPNMAPNVPEDATYSNYRLYRITFADHSVLGEVYWGLCLPGDPSACWPVGFDFANYVHGVSDLPFGHPPSSGPTTWHGNLLPFHPQLQHWVKLDSLMGHMVDIPMSIVSVVAQELVEARHPTPPPVPEPSEYYVLDEIVELMGELGGGAGADVNQALVTYFGEEPGRP